MERGQRLPALGVLRTAFRKFRAERKSTVATAMIESLIVLLLVFIGWGALLCVPAAILEWYFDDERRKET